MAKSTITPRSDLTLFLGFTAVVLLMPLWLQPFGAAYPDLMQKFAIFGLFAIGFNILFWANWIFILWACGLYWCRFLCHCLGL